KRLLSVSVVDHVGNGLSAVYTFYDPSETRRSPGTLTILHQIELTRSVDYDNLYLGYWIEDCPKMSYKTQFGPVEIFDPLSQAWSAPQ
ncbi:MAG: arginyltransferase, partial [Arenicellales bacterium]